MKLTHRERVERTLNGADIDRPAVSAWRHFYHRENTKDDLVEAMMEFQRKFDWDFMKINSRASYHIEDWGARLQRSNDPMIKPRILSLPVAEAKDWASIKRLSVNSGALGETLAACAELVDRIGNEVHCFPTVFSPLSIAGDMVDGDPKFVELLRQNPNELFAALDAITETFVEFVNELLRAGVDGIFFATTEWASRSLLTEEEYLKFGAPYDLRVLEAAKPARFNILHVCNKNNMLPLFRNYPAQILSWNPFEEGNLSIHQASQIFDKVFLTGVDHIDTLQGGSPDDVKRQIESSLEEAPRGRLMIGPGCAAKATTPDSNFKIAADTAKNWKWR